MLSSPLLWLIAGSLLCLTELIFPSAFVTFMMGISAILVAGVALFVPNLALQIVLWLLLSTGLIILSRRWLTPKRSLSRLSDDLEGKTLTEIPAGEVGRVLYEGNSWRAICEDNTLTIASGQKVYVVRRKGNTLVVLPSHLLHS
jgi:membrane protein implicated in regulation of membrane protease activity